MDSNVLLVDDHPAFRAGIRSFLSQRPDLMVVGEAECAKDAIEILEAKTVDIILLDIKLKGDINGIELAGWIKDKHPIAKILFLTTYVDEPYIEAALDIGTQGYLLKDAPHNFIIEAIRVACAGGSTYSPEITRIMSELFRRSKSSSKRLDTLKSSALTEREITILHLVAGGAKNLEIAKELHLGLNTVEKALSIIFEKLDVSNRTEAAILASNEGFIGSKDVS